MLRDLENIAARSTVYLLLNFFHRALNDSENDVLHFLFFGAPNIAIVHFQNVCRCLKLLVTQPKTKVTRNDRLLAHPAHLHLQRSADAQILSHLLGRRANPFRIFRPQMPAKVTLEPKPRLITNHEVIR